jgi:hypothetical protein
MAAFGSDLRIAGVLAITGLVMAGLAGAVIVLESGRVGQSELPAGSNIAVARPAIAVLPFTALTGEGGDAYIVDGLTEDVIAALGRYPELPVLSRSAVFPYKNSSAKIADIARDLGASYVVGGASGEHPRLCALPSNCPMRRAGSSYGRTTTRPSQTIFSPSSTRSLETLPAR